jgi:8-oxo-dGTP pyrophosphatase MutT (NUDIX family)
MTRGYIILFDEYKDGKGFSSGHAMLQKKAYFQHFSVQRNVYTKQPVCGNPGQYTLPGGRMDVDLVYSCGTLEASLKQFYEESGITAERMLALNCTDQGHYAPSYNRGSRGRGRGAHFYVHFVQVDDVAVLVEEANINLSRAKGVVQDHSLSQTEKEACLREMYETTGLSDDATAGYEMVSWGDLMGRLGTTLEFEASERAEWGRLVREQGLFFNVEGDQEDKIRSMLADPGTNRDWLVDGVKAFLYSPLDVEDQGEGDMY